MTQFSCPECGNTRRWRNLHSGPGGTAADCAACGTRVDRPDVTSRYSINIAWTDSATFGYGMTETNHF